MSAIEATPSHTVLKNRGVPVRVHRVEADASGVRWDRVYDAADAPVMDVTWVKFTNLSLADVETKWGDFEGWEKALDDRPYNTLVDTFAIMWEVPRQQAGKMLIDDAADDYATAIGAAFMMANGIEGDAVVRVIARGVRSSRELRSRLQDEGLKAVMEAEAEDAQSGNDAPVTLTLPDVSPPGLPDSTDGPSWDGTSTSSGG